MLNQMRRKDKQLEDERAAAVFSDCVYATLSTVNGDGTPYCVPISPVLVPGSTPGAAPVIYIHGFHKGQKISNLAVNNRVCISAVSRAEVKQEEYTTWFESAVAEGTAEVVADQGEYREALRAICQKYSPDFIDLFDEKSENSFGHTAIIKITVNSLTGKSSFK